MFFWIFTDNFTKLLLLDLIVYSTESLVLQYFRQYQIIVTANTLPLFFGIRVSH